MAIGMTLAASAAAEQLFDPMRPYAPKMRVERSVAGKSFELSAILFSAHRRVAIINGEPVSEGQTINGARVKSIERGRIELKVDGEILRLELSTDK